MEPMTEPDPQPNVHPQPPATRAPDQPNRTDRLHRPPDEGPALSGGSAVAEQDQAAEEEVGGG